MAKLSVPTGALLVCGVVAGPVYLAVTGAQALTRDGFDASRDTWNVLTAGDLGWIQRSNLLVVGVLTVLFAVGVRRVLGPGWGGRWASWLLVLEGVGHNIAGGLFPADPQPGFPPGTSMETTWHGAVHLVARGGGFAFVLAASLVIAGWYAKGGRRRGWAWFALATIPWGVAGVFHEVLAGSLHPVLGPIFLGQVIPPDSPAPTGATNVGLIVLTLVPTYVWFITFAVHLYRRVGRHDAVPGLAGQETRTAAKAG